MTEPDQTENPPNDQNPKVRATTVQILPASITPDHNRASEVAPHTPCWAR
jgi:hypothetical protein